MVNSSIIVPNQIGNLGRSFKLGTASYAIDDPYSPGNKFSDSLVWAWASPLYIPNKTYVFDKSKYRNDGTITGAIWKQLPSGSWGLLFDGDDYIEVGDDASINVGTSDFAAGVWFTRTDMGVGIDGLLIKGGSFVGGKRYRLELSSGKGRATIDDDNTVNVDVTGSNDLDDGSPHLAFMVKDGGNLRLYVDGSADGIGDVSGQDSIDQANPLHIGCDFREDTQTRINFLTGTIHEVWIYKGVVLSPGAMSYIYNQTKGRYL